MKLSVSKPVCRDAGTTGASEKLLQPLLMRKWAAYHASVTPDDEIKALTHAIARLETDLRASTSQAEQSHISETLRVLREMRACIVAEARGKVPH